MKYTLKMASRTGDIAVERDVSADQVRRIMNVILMEDMDKEEQQAKELGDKNES